MLKTSDWSGGGLSKDPGQSTMHRLRGTRLRGPCQNALAQTAQANVNCDRAEHAGGNPAELEKVVADRRLSAVSRRTKQADDRMGRHSLVPPRKEVFELDRSRQMWRGFRCST